MKRLVQYMFAAVIVSLLITSCGSSKQAASNYSKEAVTEAINKNEWVFTANYVLPQSGRSRNTNGLYTVIYKDNKFDVYLPYFGRAFAGVGMGSNQSPLDFKSSDFDITKNEKKAGAWEIVVQPKDTKEVRTMTYSFFDNGTANLNVILTNRTPISFTGFVAPAPVKK